MSVKEGSCEGLLRAQSADSYRLCGLCLLSRPRLKLHTLDLSRPLGVLPSLDTVRYWGGSVLTATEGCLSGR